jgi:CRISPR-associated endonuclease Cas1
MAAALTLYQHSPSLKFRADAPLLPRHGVVTLIGYGIKVRVERGHLAIEDGIASDRQRARFARVGHGLRRLVVVGNDGMISLAAIRWLADQQAAFVMLDRGGSVLVATGPVGPLDARLRRAQALAHHTGVALPIIRDLIDQKLAGQARLARARLGQAAVVDIIESAREALRTADSPSAVRLIEAQGALAYWSAWRDVPVLFPTSDLRRVPEHWRTFGPRRSPVSGSSRVAVNPANAMLNYLYAVLESEARLAAVALGLDPGLGLLHVDTDARDSLALDLMEAARPHVDAYLLDWITRQPLRRDGFFEQRNGSCRLMAELARTLAETAPAWGRVVAPVAERVTDALWSTVRGYKRSVRLATRLTQRRRREVKGSFVLPITPPARPPRICRRCGAALHHGTYCRGCVPVVAADRIRAGMPQAWIATQRPEAQARRSATRRRQADALRAWKASDQPAWITEQVYVNEIRPRLTSVMTSALAEALGVSWPYAKLIRTGQRRPHPRHWLTLARLVGISLNHLRVKRANRQHSARRSTRQSPSARI